MPKKVALASVDALPGDFMRGFFIILSAWILGVSSLASTTLVSLDGGHHSQVIDMTDFNHLTIKAHHPKPSETVVLSASNDQANAYLAGCSAILTASNGKTTIMPKKISPYTPSSSGQDVTGRWKWSDICASLSGDETCSKQVKGTLLVGFAKNCRDGAFNDTPISIQVLLNE